MDKFRETVPQVIRDYTTVAVVVIGGVWLIRKVFVKVAVSLDKRKCLAKFKDTPKDVVVLHMILRGRTIPNPSPFVMKLETFLRMANIPYQVDTSYPFGPTKKTPWITLNGIHMGDSQLIIEFLAKKFEKQMGEQYTPEEKAMGRMARILVEEHIYWGGFLWRYYYRAGKELPQIFSHPPLTLKIVRRHLFNLAKTATWYQGIGRHSQETVVGIISESLRALSLFLGEKKFLLGDHPCEDDCAVFGFLAQLIWSSPITDSPYDLLIQNELTNLRAYAQRMRDLYWPDWDKLIVK